jgi:hypothetical protein
MPTGFGSGGFGSGGFGSGGMPTATIKTILANMGTLFTGITTGAGYNNDLAKFDTQFLTPDMISAKQFPALLCVFSRGEMEALTGMYSRMHFYMYLFGYVMDNENPVNKIIELQQDVIARLAGSDNRVDGADDMGVKAMEQSGNVFDVFGFAGGVAPPYAAFRIDIEGTFRFKMTEGG